MLGLTLYAHQNFQESVEVRLLEENDFQILVSHFEELHEVHCGRWKSWIFGGCCMM